MISQQWIRLNGNYLVATIQIPLDIFTFMSPDLVDKIFMVNHK